MVVDLEEEEVDFAVEGAAVVSAEDAGVVDLIEVEEGNYYISCSCNE